MSFLGRALINAVAIAVTAYLLPGLSYGHQSYGYGDLDRWISLFLTAIVLGLVNAFLRPILQLVSAPITCLTLGLFALVVNGLLLLLVASVPILGFRVDGLFTAIVGAIVISIVSFFVSRVIPH